MILAKEKWLQKCCAARGWDYLYIVELVSTHRLFRREEGGREELVYTNSIGEEEILGTFTILYGDASARIISEHPSSES